ncbi:MAG: hypothetical protein ACI4QE_01645 [Acutalibacteraceae bacterium]
MASSRKTDNLGLNLWDGSDKPKMADFNSDNTTVDEILGEHIKDYDMHFTTLEKEKLSTPFINKGYNGNGESTREITLDIMPSMVIVLRKNAPLVKYEGGKNYVNSAIIIKWYNGSAGAGINGNVLTVKQGSSGDSSTVYNLNEKYGEYLILAFK